MDVTKQDRLVIRELARRVAEIAAMGVQAERRELWTRHNSLRPARPLIYLSPEGSWRELLPESSLVCRGKDARGIERDLRMRIYRQEHLHDDIPIEAEWFVNAVVHDSGWGLEPRWHSSGDPTGARGFDPVINGPGDLKKLRQPQFAYDKDATDAREAFFRELLGDVLEVKRRGVRQYFCHVVTLYSNLRGLGNMMMDMAAEPGMVHEAMAHFAEGRRRWTQWCVENNMFSLNNDSTYHASGGNGYTTELPAAGFDPARVRPCDMWAASEAQELAQVSPEMHEEFALAYERPLLAPFGLNGYGCCEDLTRKLDHVLRIPHLRRISISPFADVDRCAEKLGGRYIFSWKPHPSHLCTPFEPRRIGAYVRHTLDVCRANRCVLEMILKDTHTCENHPERFTIWADTAREAIEEQWPG